MMRSTIALLAAASIALLAAASISLAACGSDDATDDDAAETTETTVEGDSGTTGTTDVAQDDGDGEDDGGAVEPDADIDVVAGEAFPESRCDANRAAGTIEYLTGFDYAAAASIIEVLVADQAGYYDELCLDVQITPSFSTANYPLVAANEAQFASSGSFSELATQAAANEADLVALSVDGYVAVDVLMVKPDRAASLDELAGQTIGIKGALAPAIAVMLRQEAGLVEGDDFQTALLDGFDPFAHWAIDEIAALPGWRSNEPGALERGGESFDLYDPADFDVPGSFGLIYTNADFLAEHPSAAEDFMRATLRGLADTIADPAAAAAAAFELVEASGNSNFLTIEGETFRVETDTAAIAASTPDGSFPGVVVPEQLAAQIATYDEVGFYGDAGAPPTEERYDADLAAGLYDVDGQVIWPA